MSYYTELLILRDPIFFLNLLSNPTLQQKRFKYFAVVCYNPTHRMVLSDAQKRAMKKYQQKNKEMMAENSQRYRETHPGYNKTYYHSNLEYNRERSRLFQDRKNMFMQEARRLSRICIDLPAPVPESVCIEST